MTPTESDPDGIGREKAGRLDHQEGGKEADRPAAAPEDTTPTPRQDEAAETETLNRDALHQADYGGSREPAGVPAAVVPDEDQQGGVSADDASGGGRKPTGDRDRDYDPDGDRSGL